MILRVHTFAANLAHDKLKASPGLCLVTFCVENFVSGPRAEDASWRFSLRRSRVLDFLGVV
jgi:hypothetical protein